MDNNLFGAQIAEPIFAIATGGNATVVVIDEFELPEWFP